MEEVTPEQLKALQKKGHKYRAIRTQVDGIVFPSKRQAKRYQDLKVLLSSGDIRVDRTVERFGKWMEVPFDLHGKNGGRVGRYTADFVYFDVTAGKLVVEECKGYKVRDYALRKKVFLDNYPEFEFRET